MAHRTVLRVPRSDHGQDEPEFVLVHVASAGDDDLDLKLIGTESNEAFSVSLKHDQTSKLKTKGNTLTEQQWNELLCDCLLGKKAHGGKGALGVEAVAKVQGDRQSIIITIQKRIEGITQKLGSITLQANEEELDIFDLCGRTVQALDSAKHELEAYQNTISDQKAKIAKLEESFKELVKLKTENETQLLEKFSLLLNEKKLKIRDQQRLLAGATIDPAKVQAVEEHRLAVRPRTAGPSRKGKRKAVSKAPELSDNESESDAGFEKMEVDVQKDDDSDQETAQTPGDSATETQSEDEDLAPPPPQSPPAREIVARTERAQAGNAGSSIALEDDVPPKRELPFSKKPPAQPSNALSNDDGSETESDDEL